MDFCVEIKIKFEDIIEFEAQENSEEIFTIKNLNEENKKSKN
jgi:hypothetical protein